MGKLRKKPKASLPPPGLPWPGFCLYHLPTLPRWGKHEHAPTPGSLSRQPPLPTAWNSNHLSLPSGVESEPQTAVRMEMRRRWPSLCSLVLMGKAVPTSKLLLPIGQRAEAQRPVGGLLQVSTLGNLVQPSSSLGSQVGLQSPHSRFQASALRLASYNRDRKWGQGSILEAGKQYISLCKINGLVVQETSLSPEICSNKSREPITPSHSLCTTGKRK